MRNGASRGPGHADAIGLCAACVHGRLFSSGKGITYVSCEKSRTNDGFPRFPVVPVRECPGFEARTEDCPPGSNEGG